MKKALLALAAIAMAASSFGQGAILFSNRNIPTPAGDGTVYNIPIYEFGGRATQNGAGDLPGGVTVGLFLVGGTTPLVSTTLRPGTVTEAFAAPASQTLTFDSALGANYAPGATPSLILRAWQGTAGGAGTFEQARDGGRQFGEWQFTSRPLGGTPPGGSPISNPGLNLNLVGTGAGPFTSGPGLELQIVPEPSTFALGALGIGALLLRRRKA